MYRIFAFLIVLLIAVPSTGHAGIQVTEGDEAKTLYAADKGKVQVLVQKNKEFTLRAPGGKETPKSETITVKVGERFYIVNEEDTFVHNVYDVTDSSWVLRKQSPGNVAALVFNTPGKHSLRCAMHPIMKIDVNVVQ